MARILLNGVGRIGKTILRIFLERKDYSIIAINEKISSVQNIAYSINYDSTYGGLSDSFSVDEDGICNKHHSIKVFNELDITQFDFEKHQIDILIDATGVKFDLKLLRNGFLKKVFLTYPSSLADINMILGVNEFLYNKDHFIISTSSCNATALLPIISFIDSMYGIECADVTTIHPLLSHQKVLDSGCVNSSDRDVECNFAFGRSSMQNIIPSQTTTIKACSYVLSHISEDLISSSSFRVPTQTVGAINVVVNTKKQIESNEFIKQCQELESNQTHKIFKNNFDPLVSSDFQKSHYTTIIDHRFTQVIGGNMLKLSLWYDNEWGYGSKVVDIIEYITSKGEI
ncbi:MAG: aldehyde dehydrogenase [Campylobacterales bacterium]|nr:aldehyde dehydrogenase [Campylobacterales bacterium]